ncbi:MAG: sulfatase-like hydrolase/transferase [Haloferula sp.]
MIALRFLKVFLILVTLNSWGIADVEDRPNFVIIMADDMGFSELGCYGSEIKTPAIDKLASEGVRFSQFYNSNRCGPSRASLMTGCYPWRVGQPPGANTFANLDKNSVTLMELLKEAGYETCGVGRLDMVTSENWHSPSNSAKVLDWSFGVMSGGPGDYFKKAAKSPWVKNGKKWERPEGEYSTDLITDFVSEFIKSTANRSKPFCLYISHFAPHWPLQAHEETVRPYLDLYKAKPIQSLMQERLEKQIQLGLIPPGTQIPESSLTAKPAAKGYLALERLAINAAMIESIDKSVAKTIEALEAAGKLDNTLILVLSDNGASDHMHHDHGKQVPEGVRPGSTHSFINQGPSVAALGNIPFRNYKATDYEGGIASPLIARWPAGISSPGRISNHIAHISDILPTCLELAGISHSTKFQEREVIAYTGSSLVPALNDKQQTTERILAFATAIRDGDWKLIIREDGEHELYDLSKDRNESINLAGEYPEIVQKMNKRHKELFTKTNNQK